MSEVVTGLPWNIDTLQRVSLGGVQYYPELDWTHAIGTGTAAALERGIGSFQQASPAKPQQYPSPDWTSTIGTGTAAR